MSRLLAMLSLLMLSITASAKTPEQVRSAFLFQMAKFIEFNDQNGEHGVRFCFYGLEQGPGKVLANNAGLEIAGQQIEIVELKKDLTKEELSGRCNITYIDEKIEDDILPVWISEMPMQTMVVGESLSFLDQGGAAALIQEGKKIRLYINRQQMAKNLYRIQSRLMTVAKFYPN